MNLQKGKKKYDCEDIENLVQAYIDGILSSQEIFLFEEHLDYCLPCDKKVDFEKKLKEIIKEKAKEKVIPAKLTKELKRILKRND